MVNDEPRCVAGQRPLVRWSAETGGDHCSTGDSNVPTRPDRKFLYLVGMSALKVHKAPWRALFLASMPWTRAPAENSALGVRALLRSHVCR